MLETPIGALAHTRLKKEQVRCVRLLRDGSGISRGESYVASAYAEIPFVSFGTVPQYTYPL